MLSINHGVTYLSLFQPITTLTLPTGDTFIFFSHYCGCGFGGWGLGLGFFGVKGV